MTTAAPARRRWPVAARLIWVRWSWRDLRRRWVLVTAIALIIAIGTGTYAGLGSTATWRRRSNDESYARTHMHDVRARLAAGNLVTAGALLDAVRTIPHADAITAAAERLVVPTLVDASTPTRTILVPGELAGYGLNTEGRQIDRVHIGAGRGLQPADDGRPTAVLEQNFAAHYALAPSGRVRISGAVAVDYVGQGLGPEYFIVTGRGGAGVFAQGNFATLFVPLSSAQALTGHPNMVNDVVLTLREGTSRAMVRREVEHALAVNVAGASATVTTREDDAAYRMLYEDIKGDQQIWNVVALLVLTGAAFAAFNLISRIVESQRREIGVGMALGVRPSLLAIRPLLAGVQVAVIGVVAGVGVGLLLDASLKSLFEKMLPLPVWRTPFQVGAYLRASALGFALPVAAAAWPVWRAVHVEPVDAIRTTHARHGGRLASLARRVPVPGGTLGRMPLRNLARSPRRTLLTALGIGAAIAVLIAVLGMIDTFVRTIDRGSSELLRSSPDRLVVELDGFQPAGSAALGAVAHAAVVGKAEPGLRVGGTLLAHGRSLDVVTELLDLRHAMWTPTIRGAVPAGADSGGVTGGARGIVITAKAAADLGVRPGDDVVLRHPRRSGPLAYTLVETHLRVAGLTPYPLRFATYLDASEADLFDLAGISNIVVVRPAPGVTEDQARRAMFALPGVSSVRAVAADQRIFRDLLQQYLGILRIAEVLVLVLALLIAFNASSITIDERAREHATMFAFGLRVRTVVAANTVEGVVTGVLGTVAGVATGWLVVRWVMGVLVPRTMPDIGMTAFVAPTTVALALALGVAAVSAAPLLSVRRLREMDVPSMLRVVE